jgi:hypothetical protein
MAKGQTAMQAADEKMHQNRADAAYVIVRRHINEIDTAIAKVERDARITASDQAKTIHALREYRTVFQDASVKMRAMKDIQAQFGRQNVGSTRSFPNPANPSRRRTVQHMNAREDTRRG